MDCDDSALTPSTKRCRSLSSAPNEPPSKRRSSSRSPSEAPSHPASDTSVRRSARNCGKRLDYLKLSQEGLESDSSFPSTPSDFSDMEIDFNEPVPAARYRARRIERPFLDAQTPPPMDEHNTDDHLRRRRSENTDEETPRPMRTRRRVHIGASSSTDQDPASDYTEDDDHDSETTPVPIRRHPKKVKTKVIAAQKVQAALQSVRAETSSSPNDLASDYPEDNEITAVPTHSHPQRAKVKVIAAQKISHPARSGSLALPSCVSQTHSFPIPFSCASPPTSLPPKNTFSSASPADSNRRVEASPPPPIPVVPLPQRDASRISSDPQGALSSVLLSTIPRPPPVPACSGPASPPALVVPLPERNTPSIPPSDLSEPQGAALSTSSQPAPVAIPGSGPSGGLLPGSSDRHVALLSKLLLSTPQPLLAPVACSGPNESRRTVGTSHAATSTASSQCSAPLPLVCAPPSVGSSMPSMIPPLHIPNPIAPFRPADLTSSPHPPQPTLSRVLCPTTQPAPPVPAARSGPNAGGQTMGTSHVTPTSSQRNTVPVPSSARAGSSTSPSVIPPLRIPNPIAPFRPADPTSSPHPPQPTLSRILCPMTQPPPPVPAARSGPNAGGQTTGTSHVTPTSSQRNAVPVPSSAQAGSSTSPSVIPPQRIPIAPSKRADPTSFSCRPLPIPMSLPNRSLGDVHAARSQVPFSTTLHQPVPISHAEDSPTTGPPTTPHTARALVHDTDLRALFSVIYGKISHLEEDVRMLDRTSTEERQAWTTAMQAVNKGLENIQQNTVGMAEALHLPRLAKNQRRRVARYGNGNGDNGAEADDEGQCNKTKGCKGSRDWSRLLACVRDHLRSMLKIPSSGDLSHLPPALTRGEIRVFEAGEPGAVQCTADEFRIDLHQKWSAPFNQAARYVFSQSFIHALQERQFDKPPSPAFATTEMVSLALDAHVPHFRRKYRRSLDPLPPAEEAQRLKELAKSSRKDTLLDSRLRACSSRESLERHSALLHKLDRQAMSGDESDHDKPGPPKTFIIVRPAWQSRELADFLHKLDAVYRANWANPHGVRAIRGNAPRVRMYHCSFSQTEEGHAPTGLPRNCYDGNWLTSIPPWKLAKLEIADEIYSFHIDNVELES